MNYIALGERVRKSRKEMKLSQASLASHVEISTSFLGHVERGTRKASLETLVRLANALHVSVDALLVDSLGEALHFQPITVEEWSMIIAILKRYTSTPI